MTSQRPLARPKRAGEEFARTHFQNADEDEGHTSKKPRFDVRNPSALAPDAVEEDAILDADEIGKRGQQAKRNAVNIDGYDSDSSNEGFSARADAKAKKQKKGEKSKDQEQNDMFADLEDDAEAGGAGGDDDEEVTREGKKNNKNVRFLDGEEIEGQVTNSKSGGHVSADFSLNGRGSTRGTDVRRGVNNDRGEDSSSDSEAGDEERADLGSADEEVGAGGKKEHAPRLDAFNMKSEQEEGRFDDQGNFVRKAADADAVHDTWLEGVSKKDMKKAKEAMDKRDEEQRQRRLEDDALLTSDILKQLIPHLEKGETPLEALARFGRGKQKQKPKWHDNKAKRKKGAGATNGASNENKDENTMEVDPQAQEEDPAETRRRATVEAVTAATDSLLTRGQTEIYDTEREMLIRQYTRETGDEWIDRPTSNNGNDNGNDNRDAGKTLWEYRWADARDGGETHGPYEGSMMHAWNEAGYFGEGVEFREIDADSGGGGGGGWSRLVDFV